MRNIIYLLIGLFAIFLSCKKEEMVDAAPIMVTASNAPIATDTIIGKGAFLSYAHNLSGNSVLFKTNSGAKILRLENFNMTMGPDVHVFISKTNNYSAANVLALSKLTNDYTNSSLQFELPIQYTSNYKFALVYCIQYSSLFGYAELK